ncbi:DNA-directed RNA polymerase I subunit RPA43 [Periophthalmus magnuspinnatus]|uniref:DNA-directed RNA polymerase I subunit RPA43 n=1 Tax=Periophthalmus magnuspinnatus TaxID=409849 RepID=UPI00145BBF76|nr:DNA-directed RNA polymerase I subunit RPA43 [Periophthalmus magnuspinnatus]
MANSQHAEDNPKHVKMSGDVVVTSTPAPVSSAAAIGAGVGSSVPSFAAASELLSAPYSCLVMNTHRRHIALPPLYLNKKKTGIREELDTELLKFSQSLSGVPLAYDNIRIVGHQGDIYDDSGYIHLNIEANFILFQPKKGQTLLGMVNKLGVNHVGCLVHGCFNASIPKPNLVSMETWRDAGPQIGSELEFDVTTLDADTAGVLLIRGRLKRTRVQELLAIGESTVSTVQSTAQSSVQHPDELDASNTDETTEPMELPPEETPKKKKKKKHKIKQEILTPEKDTALDSSPQLNETINEMGEESSGTTEKKKKKKKKKKDRYKEEEQEEPLTLPFSPDTTLDTTAELNGTMDETNGNVEKKKKKKKDKHIKDEPQEVDIMSMMVHSCDSSGYLSDKPSKKRKHQTKTEDLTGFSLEIGMPCMKKIKPLVELKREFE